jgi:hypothetical protein
VWATQQEANVSEWVPQSELSSITSASRSRTAYLRPVFAKVEATIRAYIERDPTGEEVTLAVLRALGRDRLESFSADRSFDRVKQDVGLLVAQTLVDVFGAPRVHTFRRPDRTSSAARRNGWSDLDWVSSFTPHRVLPDTSRAVRILLDASVVRKVVHADADALDLEALGRLKSSHPISIADGALAELANQLARGSIDPSAWSTRVAALDEILDDDFPVAPGGRDLAAMWRAEPVVGFDLGEAHAYYRASWRFLRGVRKPRDLARAGEFCAPSGRRYTIRLDAQRTSDVLADAGQRWAEWVAEVSGLLLEGRSQGDRIKEADLRALILSNLSVDMGVTEARKLDLLIHVLAKCVSQASARKTPYRPKGEPNDALDIDLLFALPLPAWVVTADMGFHGLVRSTTSSDKSAVMTPRELLDRLASE